MVGVMKDKMLWFIGAVVVLGILFMVATRKRKEPERATDSAA
jgi:hypothetical protein